MWAPPGFYEKVLNSVLDFYGKQAGRIEEMTVDPERHGNWHSTSHFTSYY